MNSQINTTHPLLESRPAPMKGNQKGEWITSKFCWDKQPNQYNSPAIRRSPAPMKRNQKGSEYCQSFAETNRQINTTHRLLESTWISMKGAIINEQIVSYHSFVTSFNTTCVNMHTSALLDIALYVVMIGKKLVACCKWNWHITLE